MFEKLLTTDKPELTLSMRRGFLIFFILFFNSIILASGLDFAIEKDYHQFIDSLDKAPIAVRGELLAKYKIDKPFLLDSLNVRCVGRWPFGPSWLIEPSDQIETDSLLFLGSGGGIRILKLSNPRIPQMISKIDALGLIGYGGGIVKKGNLLYVLSANYGLEIYSIANPYQPQKLGGLPIRAWRRDIAVKDSFAYIVGWDSMVRVINVANPENCFHVDSLRLPEVTYGIDVQGNYAYVTAQGSGLRIIDISNPVNINEVSSIGGWTALNVLASGNLAYVAAGDAGIRIISIANPLSPQEVGYTTRSPARDLYKESYFVYAVRDSENLSVFYIVDASDSSQPTLISSTRASGWGYDVAVLSPFSYGYTADNWEGLHIININDPVNPRVDTALYASDWSYDVVIDNQKAYIANDLAGLQIVDVSNPSFPFDLGTYDTIGQTPFMYTAVAKDSFAFVPWPLWNYWMRAVDVTDPTRPRFVGLPDSCPGVPEDMIIRDSFLFIAADYRFFIFNISHPRQPRLVGSCNSTDNVWGFDLKDTFGYVAGSYINIINVANPSNPTVINTLNEPTPKVAVADTFAYILAGYDSLSVWNFANPYNPYQISSICLQRGMTYDVVVESNLAYVGSKFGITVVDVSNPINLRILGFYDTPDYVRRVFYSSPYIYCACFGSGMCILEKLPAGIAESEDNLTRTYNLSFTPNPTEGKVKISGVSRGIICIYNIAGREVSKKIIKAGLPFNQELDLSNLPQGCYIIYIKESGSSRAGKVIINKGR
jgi:hypothetical protein